MYVPPQRVRPRSIAYTMREIPAFRRWIKKRCCSVKGCQNTDIDPAHIRCDLPADALKGGTSLKPHDIWIIPLCRMHHNEQGNDGEPGFYIKYKIDAVPLASTLFSLWQRETPAGRKYQQDTTRLSAALPSPTPTPSAEVTE